MFLEASTHNIRRRVAIVGALLIVMPIATVGLAGWALMQRNRPETFVSDGAKHLGADLTKLTKELVDLCRNYHRSTIEKLKQGRSILDTTGKIRLVGTQMSVWRAKNEMTGEFKTLDVPQMMVGDEKVERVTDFSQTALVVDEIARVEGTPATIFQRLNERGDMLRLASSMKSASGNRAVGTFVPADVTDTDTARAIQNVLKGKAYFGQELQAKIVYLTAYQPIRNTLGNVVGMLATGLPEDQITSEVKHLAAVSTPAPNRPELFILKASGDKRGTAIVMGDGTRNGHDLWSEKDSAGRPYVQELCSRAIALSAGESADYEYQDTTRVGGLPRSMKARFAYVPELEWVVGFAQPEASAVAGTPPLFVLASWAIWVLMGSGVAATGLAIRIWISFSDDLADRLASLIGSLRKDAKLISDTAIALSANTEQVIDANNPVMDLPYGTEEILGKAGRMIEEIRLALQHVDASNESVAAITTVIDQITFATNLLMVNAAIESANYANENEPVAGVADNLRALTASCRKAAQRTKNEIDQTRNELEKGNRDVLELIKALHSESRPLAQQDNNDTALELRRQADALLRLAKKLDRDAEIITSDLGVERS